MLQLMQYMYLCDCEQLYEKEAVHFGRLLLEMKMSKKQQTPLGISFDVLFDKSHTTHKVSKVRIDSTDISGA